jgi:hypothetical protein
VRAESESFSTFEKPYGRWASAVTDDHALAVVSFSASAAAITGVRTARGFAS